MGSLELQVQRLREENESQRCQIEKYEEFKEESRSLFDALNRQYDKLSADQDVIASTFNVRLQANKVRMKLQDEELAQFRQQVEDKKTQIKVLEKEAAAARNEAVAMRAAAEEAKRTTESARNEAATGIDRLETILKTLENEKQGLLQQLASSRNQHTELDRKLREQVEDKTRGYAKKTQLLKEKEQIEQEKEQVEMGYMYLKAGFETALKLWYEWTRTLGTMANERADYLLLTLEEHVKTRNKETWNLFTQWRGQQSLRQCADLEITDEVASSLILACSICQGDGRPVWAEEVEWSQLLQYLVNPPPVQSIVDEGSATNDQNAYRGPSDKMMLAFQKIHGLQLNKNLFIQLGYFPETDDMKVSGHLDDVHKFTAKDSKERMRENKLKENARKKKAANTCSEALDGAVDMKTVE